MNGMTAPASPLNHKQRGVAISRQFMYCESANPCAVTRAEAPDLLGALKNFVLCLALSWASGTVRLLKQYRPN